MDFALKPVKNLVIIAFAMHIVSLLAVAAIYVWQAPIISSRHWDAPTEGVFVLPSPVFVVISLIILALHCALTISFWKTMAREDICLKRLRVISILSFIFVLAVNPILLHIEVFLSRFFISWQDIDYWAAFSTLQSFVFYGIFFRGFAFSGLLIAASMAFYHCRMMKLKGDNTT